MAMTSSGRWKWLVPGAVLASGCGSHVGMVLSSEDGGSGHDAPSLLEGGGPDPGLAADAASTFGTVAVQVQGRPGEGITLNWTVSNPALPASDRTGTVDLAMGQGGTFAVGGLPPGDGYTAAVSGVAVPSGSACSGTAPFAIQASATTTVDVTPVCAAAGDDDLLAAGCAAITALSASPSAVVLGGTIQLTAAGIDDQSASSDVTLSWSVTGGSGSGTLSAATGASPTFTCTDAAPVTVTVTATTPTSSDAASCQGNTASIDLACAPAKVRALAVSPNDHVCALLADGTVECWGHNEAGQLGSGTTDSALTPVSVLGLSGATAITTGNTHSCALLANGTVECWGEQAMLGTGSDSGLDDCGFPCSETPVPVLGLSGVVSIAAGSNHTCALTSGGAVECWGDNSSGQLGDGTTTSQLAPVPAASVTGVTAVSAGDAYTCALLSGGTVECWGYNLSGELGSGALTGPDSCVPPGASSGYPCSLKPVAVVGLVGVRTVVSGSTHSCALLKDGKVQCWGFSDVGELGNGSTPSSATPVTVSNLSGAVSVAVGVYHTCAVVSGGSVMCWGDNSNGDFCNGMTGVTADSSKPVAVSNLGGATVLSLGEDDTCALLAGGSVACCGLNTQGHDSSRNRTTRR